MVIKKYHLLYVLGALLALASCEKDEPEAERPLYPTEGAINARFSVSDKTTVVFAKGNLQYQASTGTWRFATNQYDLVGEDNALADTSYSGWIDLFGWGTSGNEGLMPYSTTDSNRYYVPVQTDISGTLYDWGQLNAISNGGRTAGLWRVLSYDEWLYLIQHRPSASVKRAQATIRNCDGQGTDVMGYVLLPDKWELPQGCTFAWGSKYGFATNVFTIGEWNLMEHAGALFLPACGYRDGREVNLVGSYGCYWTGTYFSDDAAYEFYFMDGRSELSTAARANGHSVRLVQEK